MLCSTQTVFIWWVSSDNREIAVVVYSTEHCQGDAASSWMGSVPPRYTSPGMDDAFIEFVCKDSESCWEHIACFHQPHQQQCLLLPWFSLFDFNICSWKMYIVWIGGGKTSHCFLRLTFRLDKIHGYYFWITAGNSCLIQNSITYWHMSPLTSPSSEMAALLRMHVLLSLQWKLCPPWYNLSYKVRWFSMPSKEEEHENLSPWCLLTSHPALYSFPALNSLQVYIGSKSKEMQYFKKIICSGMNVLFHTCGWCTYFSPVITENIY